MPDWIRSLTDPNLLASLGVLVMTAVIFAETGIFAGFFFPGDSLLVTAGMLCALKPEQCGFWTVGTALSIAAIAGNLVNFLIGVWIGNRIWTWRDGRLFKRRYLEEAQEFYQRYGGFAIAAGRFVPIVRTFVPLVAGIARMGLGRFAAWSLAGGLVWVWSLLALGYYLAGFEVMRRNMHYLLLVIIAVSFVPVAVGIVRRRVGRNRSGAPTSRSIAEDARGPSTP